MKGIQLYESLIERKATKIARAFPREQRDYYKQIAKNFLEGVRNKLRSESYRVDLEKKFVEFAYREYRVNLDDAMDKAEVYFLAVAKTENPEAAIKLLTEFPQALFTGDFGLEAKIGGFDGKSIDQLTKFFSDLQRRYMVPKDIEEKTAERREARFRVIEEVESRLKNIPQRNLYQRGRLLADQE